MPLTTYSFKNVIGAFFEMPADNARQLLPGHLHPMEIRHGQGVFALMAFDFTDSMVGAYTELVFSVIVPPLVVTGESMPKSAFYPFIVGTSTEAARLHAIERWHLPHYMKDIDVDFEESDNRMRARIHESDKPIIDVTIGHHSWTDADNLYQSFMNTEAENFKANIHMAGRFTEHEEETGELIFHDHPMCAPLRVDEIASYPFREMWMKNGVQTFEELQKL